MMGVNAIDLGDGLKSFEFFLNPQDQARSSAAKRHNNRPELERLAGLYYNEKLVTIDGIEYPFVYVADSKLDEINLSLLNEPYEVPERFRKFAQSIIEEKKGSFFDIPHMGIGAWSINDAEGAMSKINLCVRPVGYGEFLATNKSMDIPLAKYDPSFREGETLRSYEVVGGRALDPACSGLSNMLGLGFVVTARGKDGKSYFILGRRGKNLAVEGGTIGILGGTPEWGDKHVQDNIMKEMEEELTVKPDEFKMHRCYLAKDFSRAPDLFVHINITGPRIEDIVQRCYGNEEVMKEHDRIYAVPTEPEAIRRIREGGANFDLNVPTIVGLHLFYG